VIPASHLLSGFLAGRALRLASGLPSTKNPLLDPVVLTAIGSSVFPDWDIIPGLVGGIHVSNFHRGPTHSLVGILLQAPLIALGIHFVWSRYFADTPSLRTLFWAALAGLATHVFWDSLNPWGVTPFWPWGEKSPGNLMHEGDLYVLGVLILSSILVAMKRYRWGFGLGLAFVLSYGLLQFQWGSTIQQRAERKLGAELVRTFPNGQVACPWLVLARLADTLQAHCASTPLSAERRLVLEQPIIQDERIEVTNAVSEVVRYKDLRDFPFAELRPHPDGSTTIIWRDLREAVFEIGADQPSGYYLHLAPDGRVLNGELKWFLRIWFW
jgi:membrane-bound metal-dependent hydrolase YbcI (DUF457 family)